MTSGPIDQLLARLDDQLRPRRGLSRRRRARIRDEVEAHLLDVTDRLVADGADEAAAAREAVLRFGDVAEVGARLAAVRGTPVVLRLGLAAVALPTFAAFCVSIFHLLFVRTAPPSAPALLYDAGVLAGCLLALGVALGIRAPTRLMLAGGVVVMSQAAVLAARSVLGTFGPDPEYALVLWSGVMFATGLGLVLAARASTRTLAAS